MAEWASSGGGRGQREGNGRPVIHIMERCCCAVDVKCKDKPCIRDGGGGVKVGGVGTRAYVRARASGGHLSDGKRQR